MKRIFAFITALLMIAATACGKIEEEIKAPAEEAEPSISESSAIEVSSSESSEASESQTDSSEDSTASDSDIDKTDSKDENEPAVSGSLSGGFINDFNCKIFDSRSGKDKTSYDKQTIYKMAELAAKQYNCIIDKDAQGYLDSMNFPEVMKGDRIKKYIISWEEGSDMSETESEHYSMIAMYIAAYYKDAFEKIYQDNNDEEDESEAVYKILLEGADKIAAGQIEGIEDEVLNNLSMYEYQFRRDISAPDEFDHICSSDDLKCMININEYELVDDVTCANIDIDFMLGEYEYYFLSANIWLCGDRSSAVCPNISIKENEHKDISLDELYKQEQEKVKLKELNITAKYAYNAAAEFFADSETSGISMSEALENGAFKLANSADGLELKASYSDDDMKGKGDAAIIRVLKDDAFAENRGRIYLGITKFEYGENFFIQYKNADGLIGQYPDAVNAEGEKNIIWKTFLPRQD